MVCLRGSPRESLQPVEGEIPSQVRPLCFDFTGSGFALALWPLPTCVLVFQLMTNHPGRRWNTQRSHTSAHTSHVSRVNENSLCWQGLLLLPPAGTERSSGAPDGPLLLHPLLHSWVSPASLSFLVLPLWTDPGLMNQTPKNDNPPNDLSYGFSFSCAGRLLHLFAYFHPQRDDTGARLRD